MRVRPRAAADIDAATIFLEAHASLRVARQGELLNALDHPAFVAEDDGRIVGLLTYIAGDGECEVLTLHATERRKGIGTALMNAVEDVARRAQCTRLWLITTNDNIDAIRFYQRRGFLLVALHRDAVVASRERLKPEIPEIGDYGIPIRDELELEKTLYRRIVA